MQKVHAQSIRALVLHGTVALDAGVHMIVDSAHTPNSAAGIVRTLHELLPTLGVQRVRLILGAASDKDHHGIIRALMKLPLDEIVCVGSSIAGSGERTLPPEKLAEMFLHHSAAPEALQQPATADKGVAALQAPVTVQHGDADGESAVQVACKVACETCSSAARIGAVKSLVCITGSTYVAAKALQWVQRAEAFISACKT
jgi:folylpolyglutamate synthase/dihydropteroate synthase